MAVNFSNLISHIHELSTDDVKRLDLALEQRRDRERAFEAIPVWWR